MKKLQMRISYAFGDHAFHWLPDLLNFHGVTAVQFKGLLLRDKPALVREILVNDNPKLKYPLRNYLKQHPKSNGAALFSYATKGMDIKQASAHQTKLKYWATQLAEENRLYDTEEGVKSELAGSFSFNEYDPGDDNTRWSCNSCSNEEVTHGDDPNFHFCHISGPYFTCERCGTCQRLASEPGGYVDDYGEDMWEDYVDHLGELLGQMEADLKKKGLPTPTGLYIGARNVDWRGRDGHCLVDFDAEKLARGVSVNSEYTISNGRLYLPEIAVGYLSCRMSHHDVPMGGGVTITPYWECDLEGDPVVGDEITDHKFLARAAEHLFCGPERWHPYSPGSTFCAVSVEGFICARDDLVGDLELEMGDPIHHFLMHLDVENVRIAEDAEAIRSLIDERMEREEAA